MCLAIQPWVLFVVKYAMKFWSMLPKNVVMMLFGAALCYFGGAYTVSIAAIEAFRTMGYERAKHDLAKLSEELDKVAEANAADDTVDDDGDGIADVEQIEPSELARRKLFLMMRTVSEPERIQSAIASTWAACIAVLATITMQFAATTAIALGIVDMIKFPTVRMVTPTIIGMLGSDLKHWCTPLIEST